MAMSARGWLGSVIRLGPGPTTLGSASRGGVETGSAFGAIEVWPKDATGVPPELAKASIATAEGNGRLIVANRVDAKPRFSRPLDGR
jgi:hypothetical protein